MKKLFSVLLTAFLVFSFSYSSASAQEKINPDSGITYKTKRLKEKIALVLKFSNLSKASYLEKLLERRLYELKYIVENKQIAYLENSSQRYETSAGILTEFVLAKNVKSKKEELITMFRQHQKDIEKIRDNYSYDTSEWRLVMNDFNSLEIYISKLQQL